MVYATSVRISPLNLIKRYEILYEHANISVLMNINDVTYFISVFLMISKELECVISSQKHFLDTLFGYAF